MFKYYIEKYVNNLTINDVYSYADKNGVKLNEKEAIIIYQTIKKDWKTIIYSNHYPILERLKNDIRSDIYQKIDELIIKSKDKYKHYL